MQQLVIIGAGGFGREIAAWAADAGWKIRGFLDDNDKAAADPRIRLPVIGTIRSHMPASDEVFICALGTPGLRQSTSETIAQRGGRFATLVHPTAVVAAGARLDEGVVLCPFSLVSADAHVGAGAAIYYHCSVDHDAVVGAWSQVSGHCDIMGGAQIGRAVFLGSHAAVLPRVRVGHGAVVGAGAVVNRDVPEAAVVAGVPARAIPGREQ